MYYVLFILTIFIANCSTTKIARKVELETTKGTVAVGSDEARTLKFINKVNFDFDKFFLVGNNLQEQMKIVTADQLANPNNINTQIKMALIQYKQGKYPEFQASLQDLQIRISAQNPDYQKFAKLYLEGLALLQRGFKQNSRNVFRDLVTLNNKFVPGYINLSMAYLQDLKPDIAKFVIQNAMQQVNNDYRLFNAMGLLYKNTSHEQRAFDWFNKSILTKPTYDKALVNRATMYLEKEDYQAAQVDLNVALAHSPTNSNALMLMAIVKINHEGDVQNGKYLLGQAIRANPTSQIAKMRLAEIYIQQKKELGFARKLLNKIISDKQSNLAMIETAKNYLQLIK